MNDTTEKQCREAQGNYERWLASVEEDAKRDDWHLKLTGSDVRQLCSIIRELENRPALPPEGLVEELRYEAMVNVEPNTPVVTLDAAERIIREHYAEAADKPKVLAMGNSPVEEVLRTYGINDTSTDFQKAHALAAQTAFTLGFECGKAQRTTLSDKQREEAMMVMAKTHSPLTFSRGSDGAKESELLCHARSFDALLAYLERRGM